MCHILDTCLLGMIEIVVIYLFFTLNIAHIFISLFSLIKGLKHVYNFLEGLLGQYEYKLLLQITDLND